MADEADLAQDSTDRWLAESLKSVAAGAGRLAPKGSCYNCERKFGDDEDGAATKRFCDKYCLEDYEAENAILAKQGRRRV